MSMTDENGNDHSGAEGTQDVTQGENPGAQGDFGAGQGDPGLSDPVVGDGEAPQQDEQPRREEDGGAGDEGDGDDHSLDEFGSSDRNADPAI